MHCHRNPNYDDHGTFNMLFKKANPIWEVLASNDNKILKRAA